MQDDLVVDVAHLAETVRQSRESISRSVVIEERIQKVLDAYVNQHLSVREIQQQLHVSPSETYRILDKAGIQPNASHSGGGVRLFTDSVEQEIAAAYNSGQTMQALSALYNASRGAIRHVLQRQKVVFKDRGGRKKIYPEEFVQQLVADWHAGMSQKAIGQKHGLSEAQVYKILKPFPAGTREKIARRRWHPNWKGGRRQHLGYMMVLLEGDHRFYSMTTQGGYVGEHRLVMAESLGRPLTSRETVHHKDGDRSNNTIDNLQLRQGKHGAGVVYRCADCGSCNVVADMLAGEAEAHTPDGPPVAQVDRQREAQPQKKSQPDIIVPQLTLAFDAAASPPSEDVMQHALIDYEHEGQRQYALIAYTTEEVL